MGINSNLSVGQPNPYTNTSANTGIYQPAPGQTQPGMPADRYGQGNYGTAPGVPLMAIANDYRRPPDYMGLRIAQKMSSLGVTTTADLIRKAGTPTGRTMLAMSVAAFDSTITTAQAKQYIQGWLGMADLCRTGMSVDTARLLQSSGIYDSPSLARYAQPFDKAALYGTISTNAIRFGYQLPQWQQFSQAIDVARTLPYVVRY